MCAISYYCCSSKLHLQKYKIVCVPLSCIKLKLLFSLNITVPQRSWGDGFIEHNPNKYEKISVNQRAVSGHDTVKL